MKMKNYTKSASSRSKKKDWTYWLVVGIIACTMLFSVFGMAGFCMQVFAEELPTEYNLVELQAGDNIGNQFIKVDGFSDVNLNINNSIYRFTFDVEYFEEVFVFPPDYSTENPTDFVISLPYFSDGFFYISSEVINSSIPNDGTILYVSGSNAELVVPIVAPPGVSYLENIILILVSGLISLSIGLGTGLSTLAGSIFIANGVLTPFAIAILIFSALALSISLSRLIVRWCSSLGGHDV